MLMENPRTLVHARASTRVDALAVVEDSGSLRAHLGYLVTHKACELYPRDPQGHQ